MRISLPDLAKINHCFFSFNRAKTLLRYTTLSLYKPRNEDLRLSIAWLIFQVSFRVSDRSLEDQM